MKGEERVNANRIMELCVCQSYLAKDISFVHLLYSLFEKKKKLSCMEILNRCIFLFTHHISHRWLAFSSCLVFLIKLVLFYFQFPLLLQFYHQRVFKQLCNNAFARLCKKSAFLLMLMLHVLQCVLLVVLKFKHFHTRACYCNLCKYFKITAWHCKRESC